MLCTEEVRLLEVQQVHIQCFLFRHVMQGKHSQDGLLPLVHDKILDLIHNNQISLDTMDFHEHS